MPHSLRRIIGPCLVVAASLGVVMLGGCGTDETPSTNAFTGPSLSLPTGSPRIDPAGLVLSYDMASGSDSGVLWDFGPGAHHGQMLRNQVVASPHGQARVFTGVQDRVDLPEVPPLAIDGPLTIAVWVRVDSLGLHQHVAACDDKWALWITPDDQFRLGDTRGGGWSTDPARVRPGEWTPVVAVLRGTRGDTLEPEVVSLWVDGEEASAYAHLRTDAARASGRWGPGELYPDDACYLGFESHQGNAAHQEMPFVGAIDDVLVFDRAWSDAEVQVFSARSPGS